MHRRWVVRDWLSTITTTVFVVMLGLVVGTLISVGPANSMRRLMQGYDNAMGIVNDVTKPRPTGLS